MKKLLFVVAVSAGCTDMGFLPPRQNAEAPTVYLGKPETKQGPVVQAAEGPADAAQQRVAKVGKQLIAANQQAALRINFTTTNAPVLDVHREGDSRIVISDGLVATCATDAQLAGVLALEMASIVAERDHWQEQAADRLPPMEVRIGQDGSAGYADQVYKAELAKLGMDRRKPVAPAAPPDPERLAALYLIKAGFGEGELPVATKLWHSAKPTRTK